MAYIISSDLYIVKGYLRSIIYDLNREDYEFIPNEIADILISKINFDKIPKEIFEWLVINEFILEVPEAVAGNFLPIDLDWDYPSKIVNLTLESEILNFEESKILALIEAFNIKALGIINLNKNLEELKPFLQTLENSSILTIEIITNYNESSDYLNYCNIFSRIKSIIVYNSIFESENYGSDGFGNIVYKLNDFQDRLSYKQHPSFFNVNTELVTESLNFNNYFNRRIHISALGNIYQSLDSQINFGNITEVNPRKLNFDILISNKFKELWSVKKDHIDICKVCEHRYMCVDNRTPIKRSENEWYNLIECNYNPFIAKWSEETNYLTLEDIGITSNATFFQINEFKLQSKIKSIWSEF